MSSQSKIKIKTLKGEHKLRLKHSKLAQSWAQGWLPAPVSLELHHLMRSHEPHVATATSITEQLTKLKTNVLSHTSHRLRVRSHMQPAVPT